MLNIPTSLPPAVRVSQAPEPTESWESVWSSAPWRVEGRMGKGKGGLGWGAAKAKHRYLVKTFLYKTTLIPNRNGSVPWGAPDPGLWAFGGMRNSSKLG